MQLTIRSITEPDREIDITDALTSAIAEELWKARGGSGELNRLEAQLQAQNMIAALGPRPAVPSIVLQSRASTAALQRRLSAGRQRPRRAAGAPGRSTEQKRARASARGTDRARGARALHTTGRFSK